MNGLFRKFNPAALLLIAVACAGATPVPSLWRDVIAIGEILENPKAWEGKEVKLLAYYRWFDLFGETGTGPAVTRSDVAFADITGAIYSTPWGNLGFSPEDTERLFLLRAKVKINPKGQPYIEVKEGREVEGLPKNVVLRVRLRGGIAGFNREILLAKDGSALYLDRKLNQHSRFKVEREELEEVLKRIHPLLGRELGTPIPDGFAYTLYAWDGDKIRTLTLYPETASHELEPVSRILNGWFFR